MRPRGREPPMSLEGAASDRQNLGLALAETLPEEVDAGAQLTVAIRITPSSLDLAGAPFLIMANDQVRARGHLPDLTGDDGDIARVAFTAPKEIGEFVLGLVIPEHARDGTICREASLSFRLRTRPHVTSLAVWDCPAPVVTGETFRLKVGAQCSSSCASLPGCAIEIHDERGAVLTRAPLGGTPWPGTQALYWVALELVAPQRPGLHAWTAKLAANELGTAHSPASFAFTVLADAPAAHVMTVEVVEAETRTPIEDAQVRLGARRAATDERGLARLAVPRGRHELSVWKAGYEAPPSTIEVTEDASVAVEAVLLPVVDPDSYWQG
jgi:hypothetical protein